MMILKNMNILQMMVDEFIAFSIKIVMQGTNTSEPPRIKGLALYRIGNIK